MKEKYMIPSISVVSLGAQAVCQINYGGTGAKENNFSSWDYDFDEEEESESNFSSKSLWD